VFRFRSGDQGWGGERKDHGTYNGSYTWLDVGRERARVVDENEAQGRGVELIRLAGGDREDCPEGEVTKTLVWDLESVDPPPKLAVAGSAEGDRLPVIELDHPFLSHDRTLQKNRTATHEAEEYTIIWRWDDEIDPNSADAEDLQNVGRGKATGNGEFVRSLEVGDAVTLWARARFPGWANTVKNVSVDMYWAV
jgi:hypothetical protein